MFEFENLCCTCLSSSEELIHISTPIPNEPKNDIKYYFFTYLQINLHENEDLSQFICVQCVEKILETKKFYVQCQESLSFLKKAITEVEGKVNIGREQFCLDPTATPTKLENEFRVDLSADISDIIEYTDIKPQIDTDDRTFVCNQCGEAFKYQKNLDLHIKSLHPIFVSEQVVTSSSPIPIKSEATSDCENAKNKKLNTNLRSSVQETFSSKKRLKCFFCNTRFVTKDSIMKHFERMHSKDNELQCSICGITCDTKEAVEYHLEIHLENKKKFECSFCDKLFFRKDSFECHIRTHTGERPYECTECGKKFGQHNALKTHMTLHTGKPIKCNLCNKTFSRPSFLKIHYREHTDEKPYACDLCPKKYKQVSHLRDHRTIHFDAKPHKCFICGKAFSQKSTLRQHNFNHTGKPFKCPKCPAEFIRLNRFRCHLVSAHNIFDDPKMYKQLQEQVAKV